MVLKNKIGAEHAYYVTLTVVNWTYIFTRPVYKHIIVDSLQHCIDNKGLEVNNWH